jgi:hypothetical protein
VPDTGKFQGSHHVATGSSEGSASVGTGSAIVGVARRGNMTVCPRRTGPAPRHRREQDLDRTNAV